jgi:hypothetical protein
MVDMAETEQTVVPVVQVVKYLVVLLHRTEQRLVVVVAEQEDRLVLVFLMPVVMVPTVRWW